MAITNKLWLLAGLAAAWGEEAWTAGNLRIGVADTDAAPVVVLSPDGEHLRSGLSKDIGEMLASELGMRPEFMLIARKRVEVSIETGRVDIVCNANPDWFGNAARLGWTHEIYPQLERPLTLKQTTELRQTGDLAGKRIVTIRGYNYPTLERFWRSNPASHNEEARMELLVKSVQKRLSDVAIVSELEFAAWARNWPQEAASLAASAGGYLHAHHVRGVAAFRHQGGAAEPGDRPPAEKRPHQDGAEDLSVAPQE